MTKGKLATLNQAFWVPLPFFLYLNFMNFLRRIFIVPLPWILIDTCSTHILDVKDLLLYQQLWHWKFVIFSLYSKYERCSKGTTQELPACVLSIVEMNASVCWSRVGTNATKSRVIFSVWIFMFDSVTGNSLQSIF